MLKARFSNKCKYYVGRIKHFYEPDPASLQFFLYRFKKRDRYNVKGKEEKGMWDFFVLGADNTEAFPLF